MYLCGYCSDVGGLWWWLVVYVGIVVVFGIIGFVGVCCYVRC